MYLPLQFSEGNSALAKNPRFAMRRAPIAGRRLSRTILPRAK